MRGQHLPRWAGIDADGNDLFDTDVLTPEELAYDRGYLPVRPESLAPPVRETERRDTVDLLAALQESTRIAQGLREGEDLR